MSSPGTCFILATARAEAADPPIGKLLVRATTAKVDGQEFADQELENSVKDLKQRAKKFTLVEDESEAEFLLVVIKRETKVGQPNLLTHRTPRNVNDVLTTISFKDKGEWKAGAQLGSNGCCRYWTDSASKIMRDVEKWIEGRTKNEK